MKQNLKICFVTEDFYPDFIGGQGVYGKNLVEELAKQNISVTVFAETRGERQKYWANKKNIRLILVPFCFGNQLILALFEYIYFLIYEHKNYYDIVHVNQLSGLFFILFRPKNIGKIVVSAHNTNYDMWMVEKNWLKKLLYLPLIFLEKIIYKKADGIIFNSELELRELLKYFQIKNKKTKAIHLGGHSFVKASVGKARLRFGLRRGEVRDRVRKQMGLPIGAKIVLYVGRMVKRKKVETIIKAMHTIYNRYKNYNDYKDYIPVAVLIGKGTELDHLKKIAPPNVKFLGFVENIRDYFLAADIFVTISVAEGGFTLTSVEAASYGLPLILSEQAGGNALIKENMNGYVVDPNDSDNLADKILLTLKNQEKFSKESLRISKKFTWEKTAKKTLEFYKS